MDCERVVKRNCKRMMSHIPRLPVDGRPDLNNSGHPQESTGFTATAETLVAFR